MNTTKAFRNLCAGLLCLAALPASANLLTLDTPIQSFGIPLSGMDTHTFTGKLILDDGWEVTGYSFALFGLGNSPSTFDYETAIDTATSGGGTYTGSFFDVFVDGDLPDVPGSYSSTFYVHAYNAADDDFDDLFANFTVSVPEPTTLALLGAGLLGMGLTRRKSKS